MIEGKGVGLTFPNGTIALKCFDLQVNPGELVYVTGPSGSGKTSLLKLFMGIEYPTSGSLKVLGQSMTISQAKKIRGLRKMIGPVFQDFKLIKGRTVRDNILLGMRFLDLPHDQIKEYTNQALLKVGLEHKAQALVENLSLGESQRVAIARAVARKPVLILADEPTGNLDKANALNILELLTSFMDKDTTVVITTHATHLIKGEKDTKLIQIDRGSLSWERLG